MIYGLYNSAAGMMTTEYRQDVLANNLANAETVGFKRDVPVFAERIPAAEAGRRQGPSNRDLRGLSGGLWLGQTHTDFGEGGRLQTGNPLDVSLDGPGFFAVQADGQSVFTRDGRMDIAPDGLLVSVTDGAPVLGRGGVPLYLNPRGSRDQIEIDEDGRIFQDTRYVGQLELVDFENYETLAKVGAQRFAAPEGSGFAAPALVRTRYLEASGTQPLPELVSMIEASRTYQINAQMVTLQDQSVSRLISSLLRV